MKIKHSVHNGTCASRYNCKNLNTKICEPLDVKIHKILFGLIRIPIIYCNHYQEKK